MSRIISEDRSSSWQRGLGWAAVVALAVGSGAYAPTLLGQDPGRASADEFQQTVVPILAKNCFSCHSDRLHTAGLSLEAFRDDPALALSKPEVWTKVLDKLKAGTMPPRTMTPLTPGDMAAVTGWIGKLNGVSAGSDLPVNAANADPGRVTARRLNRVEYNNTVHDLLGVTIRPADQFPVDDSGYGFDNIGDVLSLSPMLMEKYMSAAHAVSKAAVFGETYQTKPGLMVKLLTKKVQDDLPATGNVTPFSARGALYTTYHFPVDAEYEFRIRYQNFRGGEPVITTDGPSRGRGRGTPAADTPDTPAAPARGAAPTTTSSAAEGGATPAAGAAASADAPAAGAPAAAPAAGGRGRGRGAGGRPGGAPFQRRPPTEDERKARYEQARLAAPPEPLVFTIDGKGVFSYVVQGTTDYEYSRGESIVRAKLTAGDHALRVSFLGLANMADTKAQFNPDGRRKLYVDYLDVLGPFTPSPDPPAGFKKIFICGEPGGYTDECQRRIVDNLLTRAYRRPPTAQELQKIGGLVSEVRRKDSFEEGVRVALEAVLMSPNFLFRVERDQPATSGGAAYQVSDYELASRLSYFLWSTMPDDELFQAAAGKTLHDPAVLTAQIQRMLKDPKASALADSFAAQWLNLRLLDRKKPDAAKFTRVDDELLDAMRQETLQFVAEVFGQNRSILDFIDGPFTYVNGPLARYYGIPGVDGEQFTRVDLDGEQRSGVVTQASVLTISSYATRTSPVIRGKWVLDNLLGAAPPPPPDGIPPLVETDLGTAASMRQRLEQHRANPSCAVCHNQMDPIGFGLENYDAAGAWRLKDGNFDIDSSGTLPDGRSFAGAKALKQTLRGKSDAFARNFTEKLMTYALGRGLERFDRPVVEQITRDAARDNYRFATLVSAIVNSRPFQMRSKPTGDGGAQ